MRYAIPTLFLILAALVLQSWFSKAQQLSPGKEVMTFWSDIQSGNVSRVVRHFGTNVCHCPKKQGWGAYLAYQTDEEPNLAFLLGHPFRTEIISKKSIPSSPKAKHGIPWEEPEDCLVNVHLSFDKKQFSPIFIPLAMAYGKTITNKELEDFIAQPDYEFWKSFTLRQRSSLEDGAIKFDTSNIDQDVRAEFKFLDSKPAKAPDKQISWYLTPKDAGPVLMPDGTTAKASQFQNKLPHLINANIELKVVRSAKLQPWSIAAFALTNAAIEKSDGQVINLSGH